MQSKSKNESSARLSGGPFLRLFDSFFVLRPTLIFPLWTMVLAGCWLVIKSEHRWLQWGGLFINQHDVVWWRWLLLSFAITAMFGLVYLLNQLRDKETDKENDKLFLVAEGALSKLHLIIEALVLLVMAVAFLIVSGYGRLALMVAALFILIGILYNFTPLALKQRPWGGMITYAVSGWMFLRLGGMIYGQAASLLSELPYIFAFASSCSLTNLPDKLGDIAQGKKTFVVVYGESVTLLVSLIGFLLTIGFGIWFQDWVVALPAIISTPILFKAWKKTDIPLAVMANKWAIFLLSITVGIAFAFPVYILVIFLYYPLARWYHKHRFRMTYPSFN